MKSYQTTNLIATETNMILPEFKQTIIDALNDENTIVYQQQSKIEGSEEKTNSYFIVDSRYNKEASDEICKYFSGLHPVDFWEINKMTPVEKEELIRLTKIKRLRRELEELENQIK